MERLDSIDLALAMTNLSDQMQSHVWASEGDRSAVRQWSFYFRAHADLASMRCDQLHQWSELR